MNPPRVPPAAGSVLATRQDTLDPNGKNARLRISIGEDTRHGDQPLYEAIVLQARRLQIAGATVIRGTLGYGRSTRLHTTEVVLSEDLPVVVEIVDSQDRITEFAPLLAGSNEIGLVACDAVRVLWYPPVPSEQGNRD